MNLALRQPISLPEFLAWEQDQELRYEFDGARPVAMTGGTANHNRITRRLHRVLETRLEGKPWEVFGPDLKILTTGKARYPDAVVTCTPQTGASTIIDSPVVVFEVVDPGTSRTDRIVKVREHQQTPSIKRYIILEQDSIAATVFERDGDSWKATTVTEGEVLPMPEIGIDLPLADCYAGVVLQPGEDSTNEA